MGHRPNAPQWECPIVPHLTKVCLHPSTQNMYSTFGLAMATKYDFDRHNLPALRQQFCSSAVYTLIEATPNPKYLVKVHENRHYTFKKMSVVPLS